MPENKSQHFVPRVHLRPFANGEAIKLFNIKTRALINKASISGQCARPYFYGKDGLENALQYWEGQYGSAVAAIISNPSAVETGSLEIVREFALLQSFRTYANAERLLSLYRKLDGDISEIRANPALHTNMVPSLPVATLILLKNFLSTRHYVRDLKCIIVQNVSKRKFYTSDDPAVMTNRFAKQRLNNESSGLVSSGAMLFLPLTPDLYFIAFDGCVYNSRKIGGNTVVVSDINSVRELNELQILHAHNNIYFLDDETGAHVQEDIKSFGHGRPDVWTGVTHYKKTASDGETEVYEPLASLEDGRRMTIISRLAFSHVSPSRWSRLLPIRLRPKVVDTGSGLSLVRPGNPILQERGLRARPRIRITSLEPGVW